MFSAQRGLLVVVGSTSFTATTSVSPVEVLAPQWLTEEGGLDVAEAGKLAPVIAFSLDVMVTWCTSVEALASLHHCIMEVCGMLSNDCSYHY